MEESDQFDLFDDTSLISEIEINPITLQFIENCESLEEPYQDNYFKIQ